MPCNMLGIAISMLRCLAGGSCLTIYSTPSLAHILLDPPPRETDVECLTFLRMSFKEDSVSPHQGTSYISLILLLEHGCRA